MANINNDDLMEYDEKHYDIYYCFCDDCVEADDNVWIGTENGKLLKCLEICWGQI